MPFEKGNNANPDGARKHRKFYDMLNVALMDEKANPGGLRKIADNLVKEALNGEQWAIREVADRLDGKPTTVVGGDEDRPVNAVLKVELVAAALKHDDSAD